MTEDRSRNERFGPWMSSHARSTNCAVVFTSGDDPAHGSAIATRRALPIVLAVGSSGYQPSPRIETRHRTGPGHKKLPAR